LKLRAIAAIYPVQADTPDNSDNIMRGNQQNALRRQVNLGREVYAPVLALPKQLQVVRGLAKELYVPKSGTSWALPGANPCHHRPCGESADFHLTLDLDKDHKVKPEENAGMEQPDIARHRSDAVNRCDSGTSAEDSAVALIANTGLRDKCIAKNDGDAMDSQKIPVLGADRFVDENDRVSMTAEGYGAAQDPLVLRESTIEGYGAAEDPPARMPLYSTDDISSMTCITPLTVVSRDASRQISAAERESRDAHSAGATEDPPERYGASYDIPFIGESISVFDLDLYLDRRIWGIRRSLFIGESISRHLMLHIYKHCSIGCFVLRFCCR
jgi:hypothetical protein